jgi:hypothetical protein
LIKSRQEATETPTTTGPQKDNAGDGDGRREQTVAEQLPPATEKAYQSYQVAIGKNPELADKKDKDVYKWLSENGVDDYSLPYFETWSRQVRTGRAHYGTSKHTLRKGRKSNAVKADKDPDLLKQISNQYGKPD